MEDRFEAIRIQQRIFNIQSINQELTHVNKLQEANRERSIELSKELGKGLDDNQIKGWIDRLDKENDELLKRSVELGRSMLNE